LEKVRVEAFLPKVQGQNTVCDKFALMDMLLLFSNLSLSLPQKADDKFKTLKSSHSLLRPKSAWMPLFALVPKSCFDFAGERKLIALKIWHDIEEMRGYQNNEHT
jgi:hypothetical protein